MGWRTRGAELHSACDPSKWEARRQFRRFALKHFFECQDHPCCIYILPPTSCSIANFSKKSRARSRDLKRPPYRTGPPRRAIGPYHPYERVHRADRTGPPVRTGPPSRSDRTTRTNGSAEPAGRTGPPVRTVPPGRPGAKGHPYERYHRGHRALRDTRTNGTTELTGR